MRNRTVKRIISGILTAAMLTGQCPSVLAAGADEGAVAEGTLIETDEGDAGEEEAVEEEGTVSGGKIIEDTVSEDEAAEDSVSKDEAAEDAGSVKDTEEDTAAGDEEQAAETVLPEADLEGLKADVDYVEGKLVAITDTADEAYQLAGYYKGSVESYEYGVAVIVLDEISVAQALAMDAPEGLPGVTPDYIYSMDDGAAFSEDFLEELYTSDVTVPGEKSWSSWYNGDPYDDDYLNTAIPQYQWMHDMVHSYSAWGVTTGSNSVQVAIIGSGLDATHRDFADAHGANVRAVSNSIGTIPNSDLDGSGTHSAGIIAAGLQNGYPAAGIAPGVRVLGLRVAKDDSSIESAVLIAAIKNIASLSGTSDKSDIMLLNSLYTRSRGSVSDNNVQKAITEAYNNGVTIIAGAGDEGSNALSYPAAYSGVISVGAVNRDGSIAGFSNNGNDAEAAGNALVDIYAPGVGIYSTDKGGSYCMRSSTSSAAAVVAGVAALYMSAYGHVKPDVMKRELLKSKAKNNNVVDAAFLFSGDVKSPKITINDGDFNIAGTASEKTVTIGNVIPGDGSISINAANFDGKNENTVIIYTTDGKAPQYKNGELVRGEIYTGTIPLSSIYKDSTRQMNVTIIAAAVTGMGVMSNTTTLKFKVNPKKTTVPMYLKICNVSYDEDNPTIIPLGKTIKFKCEYSGIDDSTIKWRAINEYGCLPTINEKTGVLTTSGDSDGAFVLECSATKPREIKTTVVVNVGVGIVEVGSISLNTAKGTLKYSEKEPRTTTLSVTELRDRNKKNILRDYTIALDWTSSNENVATVRTSDDDNRKAIVTAVGPGTANIVCTPMDGSAVSATYVCTVTRVPDSFRIEGPEQVIPGKAYTLKAVDFEPAESVTTDLTWVIYGSIPEGVTLNPANGRLSINAKYKSALIGQSFSVLAVTEGCESEPLDIEIVATPASRLEIGTYDEQQFMQIKKNATKGITNLNLFTKDLTSTTGLKTDEAEVFVTAYTKNTATKEEERIDLGCSWKSSNESIIKVKASEADPSVVKITAVAKGRATVTCTYNDSSRKTVRFVVTVTEPVESIKVTGRSAIVKGQSVAFKASTILPATAGNKKVTWSIKSAHPDYVKIGANGRVTLAKDYPSDDDKITVTATAQDGSGVQGTMDFVVCKEKTKSVSIYTDETAAIYKIQKVKNSDKLSRASLYTVDIKKAGDTTNENKIYVKTDSLYALEWTTSNEKVAKVEPGADGRNAFIIGVGKGTATISCKTQDGTNKKAGVKISVSVPASGLNLVPQDGQNTEYHFLTYGASVDIRTVLGSSFGNPTEKTVNWNYEVMNVSVDRDEKGNVTGFDTSRNPMSDTLKSVLGVKIAAGRLTMPTSDSVSKRAALFDKDDDQFYCAIRVTASTKDGTGFSSSVTFIATPRVEKICIYKKGNYYTQFGITVGNTYEFDLVCQSENSTDGKYTRLVGGVKVLSSDPSKVSAYYDENKGQLVVTGHKASTEPVILTVTTRDGSNVKLEIKTTVQ